MILVAPDHIEGSTGRLLATKTAAEQRAISGKYVFETGDIVYSKIRPYLRKAILANFRGLCSADMYPLKPANDVASRFMLAVVLGHHFSTYAESVSVRSGMPKINRAELADYSFALPPLPEQRAITAALSDADALLGGLDRLIAKKRDLKQAAMQQLLTGQTRLPGFHGEWEVKRFDEVLVRLNAKASQIQTTDYQTTGSFPVVDQGKLAVVGFSDRADKRFRCPNGGVIVFGDHTCIVKFICFDFLVGADGTQVLRGRDRQSTLFHALQLQYRGIEPTGYNRHFKFLKEREFLVPPLPEQTAIAAALSDMGAELSALEARRDKTRALKQAMMQELLTGRTRLVPAGGPHA
jgi:type I restriction enzyme S subunit